MEKYCITLEQAKRLIELGFKRGVEYWWIEIKTSKGIATYFDYVPVVYDHLPQVCYPAYHVGELLELLPNEVDEGTGNYFLTKRGQLRGYLSPDNRWLVEVQGTKPEAEAFGDLLIYLLESKLI